MFSAKKKKTETERRREGEREGEIEREVGRSETSVCNQIGQVLANSWCANDK